MFRLVVLYLLFHFSAPLLHAQDLKDMKGTSKGNKPKKPDSEVKKDVPAKKPVVISKITPKKNIVNTDTVITTVEVDTRVNATFATNRRCSILLDNVYQGEADPNSPTIIRLEPGTYNLQAISSDNTVDKYSVTVEIASGSPKVVIIPLEEVYTKRIDLETKAAEEQKRKDEAIRIANEERLRLERIKAEEQRRIDNDPKVIALRRTIREIKESMITIGSNTFQMGSTTGNNDEFPIRSVSLSRYQIARYEVTQFQWRTIMGNNPSKHSDCDNCPVEYVSWNEVQEFILKLNTVADVNFRLPTEAEWEYAARGNSSNVFSGSNTASKVSWYLENSAKNTHPIGGKSANQLGLFDLSGNVAEWCSDWYAGSYDKTDTGDPSGPGSGKSKVIRGGSWDDNDAACRVTYREKELPTTKKKTIGFRLVQM